MHVMQKPFYSIIIPALNEENYLPHLLDSLCEQSEKDFEVIVVDAKSKDLTVRVARSYDGKIPIQVMVSRDRNVSKQRNQGAWKARGEWFVFVDADTVLLPYALARLRAYIAGSDAKSLTAWGKPDSEKTEESMHMLLYNFTLEACILLKRPMAPGPFGLVHRDAFIAVGGYLEAVQFGEDQNLTQRLADAAYPLHIIRETLYIWSQRRFRTFGFFRTTRLYMTSGLRILLTKKSFGVIPEYIMGGHAYERNHKKPNRSMLKKFEGNFKKLVKEFLE
ncbi:glycosyltransferase family 2 protein [Candidatus Gottesmanbacteria bacterium]|nr:glycosyltransferase family 2 protein [Candidatus Gottesmanbacteria bacterium]